MIVVESSVATACYSSEEEKGFRSIPWRLRVVSSAMDGKVSDHDQCATVVAGRSPRPAAVMPIERKLRLVFTDKGTVIHFYFSADLISVISVQAFFT